MALIKTLTTNRKARFDYEIIDTTEAGLALVGTEIKAMREGRADLSDAYARPENGEMWLMNLHVGHYSAGSADAHEPKRPRKLLLHRQEIAKLSTQVLERGLTIVPLRLYLKGRLAKVELGLAKGRKRYDKRRGLIEKEREREARNAARRAV